MVPTLAERIRAFPRSLVCLPGAAITIAFLLVAPILDNRAAVPTFEQADQVQYKALRDPRGPWSIHVVRVPRGHNELQLSTVHAGGRAVGLSTVSQQVRLLKTAGTPIAAINGDFYRRDTAYAGNPRGLQIAEGELLSGPANTATFWIDAIGEPHMTNTSPAFEVTWPGGQKSRFGLNGARRTTGAQLYTPSVGNTTRTAGGREFILECAEKNGWPPLRVGKNYTARVREVRDSGNSRIQPDTVVLSVGPALARTLPKLDPGTELELSTETIPALRGVKCAVSGGPVLVRDGKRQRIRSNSDSYESSSMLERHPRSAVGWNAEAYFLVEVDGRQPNSVGMTLNELGSLLVELGCSDGMNLDGGGSSALWFEGRIRNRPCDGEERPVANALVVVRKSAESQKSAKSDEPTP